MSARAAASLAGSCSRSCRRFSLGRAVPAASPTASTSSPCGLVTTIAAIGLNLTLGYAGQVSLAQARLRRHRRLYHRLSDHQGGWPFWCSPSAAPACSRFAIGWLLGFPALRVQHHYLAFVTLAFSTLVWLVFRNEEWLTGGIYGISDIARPVLLGWSMRAARRLLLFLPGDLALVSLALWWILRSPWGRAFVALRENPLRAALARRRHAALHADRLRARLGLGGIAGALYAPLVQFIDPSAVRAGPLAEPAADGGGRRLRLLPRPVPRRDGGRPAAGMAALHARAST